MFQKVTLIISFFLLLSLVYSFASPLPPQDECFIQAQIIERGVPFYPYSDLAIEEGLDTDVVGEKIVILSVNKSLSTAGGYDDVLCDEYNQGDELVLFLNLDNEYAQTITGTITWLGDEYSSFHSMENIVIINESAHVISEYDVTQEKKDTNLAKLNRELRSGSLLYDSTFFVVVFICVTILIIVVMLMTLSRRHQSR